jgi:hypothetical protein
MSAFSLQMDDITRAAFSQNQFKSNKQSNKLKSVSNKVNRYHKKHYNNNIKNNNFAATNNTTFTINGNNQPFTQQYQQIQAATAVLNKLLEKQQLQIENQPAQSPLLPAFHGFTEFVGSPVSSLSQTPLPLVSSTTNSLSSSMFDTDFMNPNNDTNINTNNNNESTVINNNSSWNTDMPLWG